MQEAMESVHVTFSGDILGNVQLGTDLNSERNWSFCILHCSYVLFTFVEITMDQSPCSLQVVNLECHTGRCPCII